MTQDTIKAISIHQPFAHLIAIGEKRVENRSIYTPYRGRLVIHASKTRERMTPKFERRYPDLIFGALIAVCDLTDCVPWPLIDVHSRYEWMTTHRYVSGPWCWILSNVRPLASPIPWRAMPGLFNLSSEAGYIVD